MKHHDEFCSVFNKLIHARHPWEVWNDLIAMVAIAISNSIKMDQEKEENYLKTIQKYEKKEQELFTELYALIVMSLEKNAEQDLLGSLYSMLNLNNKSLQQFFTPYYISDLMAKITLGDVTQILDKKKFMSINDPTCGAGSTLIAAANEIKRQGINYQKHVLFVGQDIDPLAAKMCYIQLSLLGCPGYVIIGNSLVGDVSSMPIWYTPMYYINQHCFRKVEGIEHINVNDGNVQLDMESTISDPILEMLGL